MSQKHIHCLIRKTSVVETPEEIVRQSLLKYMIDRLGFPKETLAVEKGLDQMPHLNLSPAQIPNRRADIICFATGIHSHHSLYPLLLIECKSFRIDDKAKSQVIGYNQYLHSYYIALACENEIQTGWYNPTVKGYEFVQGLPTFEDLKSRVSVSF